VISKWPWWVPTNKFAAVYVAFYIYDLMTMIYPMTKNLPTVGRGVAVNTLPERYCSWFPWSFSSSCTIVVAVRIWRKREEEVKKRKERNKERNCPKKFVTGLKRKGKGSPENTVY
jgi:hypothetical protein